MGWSKDSEAELCGRTLVAFTFNLIVFDNLRGGECADHHGKEDLNVWNGYVTVEIVLFLKQVPMYKFSSDR